MTEVLKDILANNISLDDAIERLSEFDDSEDVIAELEYLEDNFRCVNEIKKRIRILIEDIEHRDLSCIEKPSLTQLNEAIKHIDRNKLLLKNMVIK